MSAYQQTANLPSNKGRKGVSPNFLHKANHLIGGEGRRRASMIPLLSAGLSIASLDESVPSYAPARLHGTAACLP